MACTYIPNISASYEHNYIYIKAIMPSLPRALLEKISCPQIVFALSKPTDFTKFDVSTLIPSLPLSTLFKLENKT